MRITMKMLACAAMMMVAGAAHAQERAAVGATDTQMTWTALSGQISSLKTTTDGVITNIDALNVCGKKGMIYAPGVTGADAQGCIEAGQKSSVTTNISKIVSTMNTLSTNLTTVNNNVNTLTATTAATTNNVNNILNCNKAGMTFNGSSCISTKASCSLVKTAGSNCGAGQILISEPATVHVGGGNSPNGTGFDTTGGAPSCVRVVCQ